MKAPTKAAKLKASKAAGSPNLKQAVNNREGRRMANRGNVGSQPRVKPGPLTGSVYVAKGKPTDESKRVSISTRAAGAKKTKATGAMNKTKANRKMGY